MSGQEMTQQEMYAVATKATLEFCLEKIVNIGAALKLAATKNKTLRRKLKSYLQRTSRQLCQAKTLLAPTVPRDLYAFYVPLNVDAEAGRCIESPLVGDLKAISPNVLIMGLGGCGKSTFLQHLFIQEARNTKPQTVPIFFRLRNCQGSRRRLLGEIQDAIGFDFLSKPEMTKVFASGGFSFFLDGFDEVAPEKQASVKEDVLKLAQLSSDNTVIVTSRPGDNFVSWEGFAEVSPSPLTCEKALELVSKSDFDPSIKQQFSDRLKDGLFEKHESFLSNPLLLTIMLLVFRDNADIPHKLHLFYEKAFEALYGHHDASKPEGYKRKHHCELAKDDFSRVLEAFSALTYRERKHEFTEDEVYKHLEDAKIIVSLSCENQAFLKDLVQSVCILVQDGTGYTYTHRSFQEYFAARFLATRDAETVKKVLPSFMRPFGFHESMMEILWEISRQLVEEAMVIPFLEKLREHLNISRRITASVHARYLQLLYSSCNWNPHSQHTITVTYRNHDPKIFPFSPAFTVAFIQRQYELVKYPDTEFDPPYVQYMTQRFGDSLGRVEPSEFKPRHKLLPILDLSTWLGKSAIKRLLSLLDELKQKHALSENSVTDLFGLKE